MNCIGDVKYSILEPQKFTELHEPGWVIMRGQFIDGTDPAENPTPSRLFQETGLKQLPDGRGLFIRGMNLGQDLKLGDANGVDSAGKPRAVGSFQEDIIKNHQHNYQQAVAPGSDFQPWGGPLACFRTYQTSTSEYNSGYGDETRPRNICLFIYIKIN